MNNNTHPIEQSNDGHRAIDDTLARWVLTRTGSPLLARAAHFASVAEGHGHACAQLGHVFNDDELAALREHAWVGAGVQPTPFVLDAQARFYLWRNWQHETRLADGLRERVSRQEQALNHAALAADLELLFAGTPREATQWQRAAVALVPGTRLFVLTGGPGTGKTTTVLRMLLMLLRRAEASGLPARPTIALAAPTGKAAQRLAQSIAHGKATLRERLAGDTEFADLLERIPHAEASTLHRLLGFNPHGNRYAHGVGNPLAADIVVIDEASMIDLAMMRQLVESLRPETLLILLGDPDQLASIDAGSVLADIVTSVPTNTLPAALAERITPLLSQPVAHADAGAPLSGHVLTLTHGWRAGGGLQRGIEALRGHDSEAWLQRLLAEGVDGDLHLLSCVDRNDVETRCKAWLERQLAHFERVFAPGIAPAEALRTLREMQLLCALREGPFGANGVNAVLTRLLAARFDFDVARPWYHGRPLIVTRNDYVHGLFNGDIGIALHGRDGLRVWFETNSREGEGLRSYTPRALPAHETAWAITIHRSQGSEYRDVAVLLPPDPAQRVLSRELLYTAVSRAREHAELWTSPEAMRAAIARPIERQGGLRERLR